MATSKDKLNEIINFLNESDISEVIDFAEFLLEKNKRKISTTETKEKIQI